jgi:hypothetical protein
MRGPSAAANGPPQTKSPPSVPREPGADGWAERVNGGRAEDHVARERGREAGKDADGTHAWGTAKGSAAPRRLPPRAPRSRTAPGPGVAVLQEALRRAEVVAQRLQRECDARSAQIAEAMAQAELHQVRRLHMERQQQLAAQMHSEFDERTRRWASAGVIDPARLDELRTLEMRLTDTWRREEELTRQAEHLRRDVDAEKQQQQQQLLLRAAGGGAGSTFASASASGAPRFATTPSGALSAQQRVLAVVGDGVLGRPRKFGADVLSDAEVAALLEAPLPEEALAAEEAALVQQVLELTARTRALRREIGHIHHESHTLRLRLQPGARSPGAAARGALVPAAFLPRPVLEALRAPPAPAAAVAAQSYGGGAGRGEPAPGSPSSSVSTASPTASPSSSTPFSSPQARPLASPPAPAPPPPPPPPRPRW